MTMDCVEKMREFIVAPNEAAMVRFSCAGVLGAPALLI
jgi:hypothetical protein